MSGEYGRGTPTGAPWLESRSRGGYRAGAHVVFAPCRSGAVAMAPGRDIAAITAKDGQPSAQPRRVSAQPSSFRNDSSGGSKAAHATDQKELDPKRRHTPRPDTPQPARSRCCRRGGLQARPAGPSCCRDERTPRPIDRRGTRLTSAATHQVGPRKPKLGESASTEVQHLLSTRHRPAPFRPP